MTSEHRLRFEIADVAAVAVEPERSAFKLQFVQCASCGAVVGVVEHYNVGSLLGC